MPAPVDNYRPATVTERRRFFLQQQRRRRQVGHGFRGDSLAVASPAPPLPPFRTRRIVADGRNGEQLNNASCDTNHAKHSATDHRPSKQETDRKDNRRATIKHSTLTADRRRRRRRRWADRSGHGAKERRPPGRPAGRRAPFELPQLRAFPRCATARRRSPVGRETMSARRRIVMRNSRLAARRVNTD